MNNERIKSIKNIICYALAFVLASLGCITLLSFFRPKLAPTHAASGVNEITIPDGNFNTNPRTSYPYSSNSFKKYFYNTETSDEISPNIQSGIVNLTDLSDEDFADKLKNVPTNVDNYALMIDSEDYEYARKVGYRTSNNITLSAGKNYLITVDAYTLQNQNIAGIYLYEGEEIFASFPSVNSYNRWSTYNFFVRTSENEALDLKIGMYLENAGTVLFDNISCTELTADLYQEKLSSSILNKKEVDLLDNVVAKYSVNSENKLVNTLNHSDFTSFNEVESLKGKNDINYTTKLLNEKISDGEFNSALVLENKKDTYIKYSTADDFITVEKGNIYKVTVKAYVTNSSKAFNGKVGLSLIQTDEDKHNDINLSVTSKTTGFVDYSFYINGHPTEDANYKFVFGLGDSTTLTTGKLYISSVTVSKLNYAQFESANADNKKNLATDSIYNNSAIMINNGSFDGFKVEDYNSIYPATPINWSVSTGAYKQYYGVVNSDDNLFSTLDIASPYAPGANENLLLMYNTTNDTLSYKSDTKSLTKDTYHKFQLDVKTINADAKISLVSTVDNKEVTLSSLVVRSAGWTENATLYLHTGHTNLDVAVKIELITTEGAGYIYIDNARFDYPDTSVSLENQFNNASTVPNQSVKTDLSNILSTSSTTPWESTGYFSGNGSEGVEFGIIPTNNDQSLTESVIEINDLINFKKVNSNVLGIRLNNGYYSVKSNLGFALESNDETFYKISVSVFTKYLEYTLEEDEKLVAVSLGLSNFEEKFTGIESNGDWTTYSFYIDPDKADTSYINLSLGSEEQPISGVAFFGDIKFEPITKEDFDQLAVDGDYVKVLKTVTETTTEDEEDETTEENTNNSNWIYYIPSILFALAIIIAIVGVMLRKMKKKKKPTVKKTKNNYDRNATVSKQIYMRRATTLRENKLAELNKDLARLTDERSQYETEYKQNMSKLREMKLHRADAREIANLEHSMKKAQRHSAQIGVSINNIELEIEHTKTDSYLNSLVKKLAREGLTKQEDDETEE